MNAQDMLNAIYGLGRTAGFGPQPIPPPMGPGRPSMPGADAHWYDWANYVLGGNQTPQSIHNALSQGQAGADYRQATGDYAANLLAAGADPSLPPLSGLWQAGQPQPTTPAGTPGWNFLDALHGRYGSDVPLGAIQQPSNAYIAALSQPGTTGQLPTIPGAGPPMGPGLSGNEATGSMWNSILSGLSGQHGDPTQNVELGPAGGVDITRDPMGWLRQLGTYFGIGKGPAQGPQGKGTLESLADQINQQGAAGGGQGKGVPGAAGVVANYNLGKYQEPPPAPHEAIPAMADLSPAMNELRAAEPQRVALNATKGQEVLAGIAHGMASAAGHGFGTQLLAGAGGGLEGGIGYEHELQRNEQNFQNAMRDFHYRLAEGELHQAQMTNEHNRLAAEIDYHNQTNDYNRQLAIIEAHQPQAQVTPEGLVIKQIDPKTGQYKISIDSRPIDHIWEARMALRAMGANPMAISSFTSQATGASSHSATPADAALNLGIQLADRPDLWPGLFGDKFNEFNMKVQQSLGKGSAYGTVADLQKGKVGELQSAVTSQTAIARMLQNEILSDPSQEIARRAVGLLSGRAVIGAKNAVQANPFFGGT